MQKVGIIGLGWLGTRLAKSLEGKSRIFGTVRSNTSAAELKSFGYSITAVDFANDEYQKRSIWELISSIDVIVVMVPFSVRKANAPNASIKMSNLLNFLGSFQGQLFFISSTGVYPREKKNFTETSLSRNENLYEEMISKQFPQVNILRLGGLMGDNRLLRNYKVSSLDEPVNHVHYRDVCRVINKMIDQKAAGKLYNVVAPLHPKKAEVIAHQQGNDSNSQPLIEGRIIKSDLIMKELSFHFDYPDPKTFHLDLSNT
ncbi:MAG: hypothetical protein AAF616_08465 [Bacteroidota bacterium]